MAAPRRRSAEQAAGDGEAARLALAITPGRRLIVRVTRDDDDGGETAVDAEMAARIGAAFESGAGAGLLQLGTAEVTTALPPALGYWRDLAARYVAAVCARGEDAATGIAAPDE